MKKTAAIIILFLFALLVWNVFTFGDSVVNIDGEDIGGPLGALLATFFAGGGLLLAGVIMLFVGAVLAVVFAGVGVLCIGGLAIGACVLALMVSPLLLPLLVPVAIVWFFVSRSRKHRVMQQAV
ncbi:hypothetical protein NX784_06150 [Massilia pinisoli]|uniref:DUF4064 domain-containing protein n=1 Tax=Massilia pinisoli TaxID=1772194 RepID=A0ABT1ZMM7_9BURK|nr:hypothetical protein [Massilia pinisoli]MCS0581168.1 hypothetical protein [Massilia pinisoli]